MAKTLRAPFNFVPLNDKVYTPDWADSVSQDVPFSDGEDGYIDVEFENMSPLFTRDGYAKDNKTEYSSHVNTEKGKLYFIPATSLKGMTRSVLEIFSYSKLKYDDKYFGYRTFGGQNTDGGAYTRKMANVKAGWLRKTGLNEYRLFPCKFKKVPIKGVKDEFKDYEEGASSWKNNSTLDYPEVPDNGTIWRLVCTGGIDKKIMNIFSRNQTIIIISLYMKTKTLL